MLAVIPFLVLGCASLESLFGAEKIAPPLDSAARQNRIASLQTSIEEDHNTLEALVSGQRDDSDGPLHENKDLRAIAERLSRNEEELEMLLRAERADKAEPTVKVEPMEQTQRVEQTQRMEPTVRVENAAR